MKKKYCHWSILGMALIMLLVLTTACDVSGQTAAPTSQPLTLLKESQQKMSELQSLALNGTSTVNTSSTGVGDSNTQVKISGKASPRPPTSSSLKIDGTVTIQGIPIPLSLGMILVNQQGYIQNAKNNGPWYTLSDQQGKNLLGEGISSLISTSNTLLDALTASDITDHGLATLNGKKLRHLTVNTAKALKKFFLESTGNFKNLTQAQLDSINLQTSTTDYWIDEATLYTYQQDSHYVVQYHIDSTGTITSDTPNVTQSLTMTLTYSNFNVPVSIKAPKNARPLRSILDLVS